MIDFGQVLSNIFSNIPWWFYPLLILALYLKAKMENFNLEQSIRKRKKIYDKIDEEKNENNNEYMPMSYKDRKEKGDKYEEYICELYKKENYIVEPHGKKKGVHDLGIDIIAKKGRKIIFIQCKDWDINNKYKITHKDIQYTRMNARDYINIMPMFEHYDWKILYITTNDIFDKSAYYKINEHSDEISYKIVPYK